MLLRPEYEKFDLMQEHILKQASSSSMLLTQSIQTIVNAHTSTNHLYCIYSDYHRGIYKKTEADFDISVKDPRGLTHGDLHDAIEDADGQFALFQFP